MLIVLGGYSYSNLVQDDEARAEVGNSVNGGGIRRLMLMMEMGMMILMGRVQR